MDDTTSRTSPVYQGGSPKAKSEPDRGRGTKPPDTLAVLPDAVPRILKDLPQWVAWRSVHRDGRYTKVPIDPKSGGWASCTDADTWDSFERALAYANGSSLAGVGFVFHPDDPFSGVDLDDCRDPERGEIAGWALQVVRRLYSYAEVSPTGTGAKIIVRARKPLGRNRKGHFEMYDRGRFFTITGHRLADVPEDVESRQEELVALHRRLFGERKEEQAHTRRLIKTEIADDEILRRARSAANGEKFRRLWSGDTSLYATGANGGKSEADLALCSILAFWCGPDEVGIDRLFRQSGLYRSKWERADYRALTIAVALDRHEFWRGNSRRRGTVDVGPPSLGEGVPGKAVIRHG